MIGWFILTHPAHESIVSPFFFFSVFFFFFFFFFLTVRQCEPETEDLASIKRTFVLVNVPDFLQFPQNVSLRTRLSYNCNWPRSL